MLSTSVPSPSIASFCASVALGRPGHFVISGIDVKFTGSSNVGVLSRGLSLLTQKRLHVFVHEMSHALADRFLTGRGGQEIEIHLTPTRRGVVGTTWYDEPPIDLWKDSMVCAAGPVGNLAFSTVKLVIAKRMLTSKIWSVFVSLVASAGVQIANEVLYAFSSAFSTDGGDFGLIRQNGLIHLSIASMVLAAQVCLATLVCISTFI